MFLAEEDPLLQLAQHKQVSKDILKGLSEYLISY